MEIIVETHQQALRQADVFCRNNDTEGKVPSTKIMTVINAPMNTAFG